MGSVRVILVLTIIGLVFCSSGLVSASGEESNNNAAMLEEIVVTGTRTTEEIRKIPANVTVITSEEIRASGAKNIPDLLRNQEGITVRDFLGNAKTVNVDLRGFGEAAPSNTLVLVDGRRVNAVDLSGVDWMQIPIDQVERIEIVRGTGTVLYGDNAVGGVINIITKTPSKKLRSTGRVSLGSYGWNKGSISLSGGHGQIVGSFFASYDSTDGYRENSGLRGKDIGGKMILDATDILSFTLSCAYHSDKYGLPGSLSKQEMEENRRASNSPLDNAHTIDKYINLGTELDLQSFGSIVADISCRRRDTETNWISWSWMTKTETTTKGFTPRYTAEWNFAGHKDKFIAGIDFYWSDMDVVTSSESINKDSRGYYFNNDFSIFQNLIISLGARHERAKYEFDTSTTKSESVERQKAYSAGLTYLYGDKSSIFFRANKSFRFPLTDELFSSFTGLNEDLRPQEGKHYELGIRHYFGDNLRISGTLFRAKFDNEIFYNPLTFSNQNHPKTLHQGVELGIKVNACRFLACYANYTYEKATFEEDPFDGNDIPAVPRRKGNVGFTVQNIKPGLRFNVQYNYVGSSYVISDQANAKEKLDSYHTIDSKISYSWRNLEAFFGVNNLTNEKYSQYAVAGWSGVAYYPSPERNWSAGVSIQF